MLEGERHGGDRILLWPRSDAGEMSDHAVGDGTLIAIAVDVKQVFLGWSVIRCPQPMQPGSIHAGETKPGDERADHVRGGGGPRDPASGHALQLASLESGSHRPWSEAEDDKFAAPSNAELPRGEVQGSSTPTVRAEGRHRARRQDQSTRSVHVPSLGNDGAQRGETVIAVDNVEVGRNRRGRKGRLRRAEHDRFHQKTVCGEV
ncbi:hypothetical protein GCM10023160_09330 [Brachybacterium paraconglomeratum]